jgi:hypothetical protein
VIQPVIKVHLVCDTQTRADQVLAAVQQLLANRQNWVEETALQAILWHNGLFLVHGLVRFTTQADADLLYSDIKAAWTSGPQAARILGGNRSFLERYDRQDAGEDSYLYVDVKA